MGVGAVAGSVAPPPHPANSHRAKAELMIWDNTCSGFITGSISICSLSRVIIPNFILTHQDFLLNTLRFFFQGRKLFCPYSNQAISFQEVVNFFPTKWQLLSKKKIFLSKNLSIPWKEN